MPHTDDAARIAELEAKVAELEARLTPSSQAPGPAPAKRGRRGRFTRITRERVLAVLVKGGSDKMAAELANITPRTLKRWLQQGRAELDALDAWDAAGGPESGQPQPPFTDLGRFVLDHAATRAAPDQRLVDTVVASAERGDWRAAMSLLRSRRPGEFAEVQRHQAVTEDEDGELTDAGDGLVDKILAIAGRVRGEGGDK
ncbi:MAG: hypothetical protein KC457_09040 [Myxococcales bacterium]|nr:hypothetical protein [Myxococcales bacterium]